MLGWCGRTRTPIRPRSIIVGGSRLGRRPDSVADCGQNDLMPEAVLHPRRLQVLAGVPHAIPYQGSKRALAHAIVPLLPADIDALVEPFCGSAAVAVGALYAG